MPALSARAIDTVDGSATIRPALTPVDDAFVVPGDAAAADSPALALQRRLGDAVLRGWCEPRVTAAPRFNTRQAGAVVACAAVSWAALFGAGWALLG